MNKHTPGPWKVRTAYSNGEPVCYTIHLGQTSIADVTSLSEQDRVNATLIAAAPAMYEALQDAIDTISHMRHYYAGRKLNEDDMQKIVDNGRAALSQAEGRHHE